jgi:FlaA1/EpsC-like NDP-sugar epimerase
MGAEPKQREHRAIAPAWLPRSSVPLALIDVAAWGAGIWSADLLRLGEWEPRRLGGTFLAAAAIQLAVGLLVGLYRGKWAVGRFEEAASVSLVACIAAIGATFLNVQFGRSPRTVPLIAAAIALAAMQGARYVYRVIVRRRRRPNVVTAERMLVFGAGAGAQMLMPQLMNDPKSPYRPVALLDDFPGLRSRTIHGVAVVGTRNDIAAAARRFNASLLLIAVPSADSEMIRDITALASAAGLQVKVLPRVAELVGSLAVSDIRSVTEADLLGRRVADLDLDSIARYVTGRRVLVTGAGGSIGSELCRQLTRYNPASLAMLDRDESALHGVQLSISGRAMLDDDGTVLVDIRDRDALNECFERIRPEVVFHAAALKHLPMLERFPLEAWKTNVIGTQNVINASRGVRVERFINISTDKAADPVSVLGWSKRITERLVASAAQAATTSDDVGTYVSVRFGNVLGSRGSVLIAFRDQVEKGGPVTVTHPDVTRYFMMVEEAVALTIQAGAIGRDGEVLILDMGEPVRIADVAERLIAASGKSINITYTGLRDGEKLHEDLVGLDELDVRPIHNQIAQVAVPPCTPAEMRIVLGLAPTSARETMVRLATLGDHGVPSQTSDV